MANFNFSENPLWEEAATILAKQVFGHAWTAEYGVATNATKDKEMLWRLKNGGEIFVIEVVDSKGYVNICSKTPARQEYYSNGKMLSRTFFSDGKRHDPEDEIAAYESYYSNGTVKEREFYMRGRCREPSDGLPLKIKYYDNGIIQETCREFDTEHGEPAVVSYSSDGRVVGGTSSKAGGFGKLSGVQTFALLEAGKKKRAALLCGGSLTVVAGKSTKIPDAAGYHQRIGNGRVK